MAPKRPDIDGLRGIACLIVLVAHSLSNHYYPEGAWLFTGTGGIGVLLFFVLSAALLTVRLVEDGFARDSLVAYSVARFVRIMPMFWIAVLVYFLLGEIDIDTPSSLWTALTFQTWHWHLWTVPIELQFYVLLPLILAVAVRGARKNPGATFAVVLCSASALDVYWQVYGSPAESTLVRYVPTFLGGLSVGLALLYAPRPTTKSATMIGAIGFCGVIALTVLMKSGALVDPTNSLARIHNLYGLLWSLTTYAVFIGGSAWSRWLSWKPLSNFGKTIYSTYLFHYLFVILLARRPEWWAIPACIGASIASGWAGYAFGEQNIAKLRGPLTRTLTRWRSPFSSRLAHSKSDHDIAAEACIAPSPDRAP